MDFDLSGLAGVILGTIATAITGAFAYFGIIKKSDVDETSIALTAWKELVAPMQIELARLQQEVSRLKDENFELRIRVRYLESKEREHYGSTESPDESLGGIDPT